ncbi:hypothetical protein GEMRC1_004455 [Eukaryota sp. GEM-RC1]
MSDDDEWLIFDQQLLGESTTPTIEENPSLADEAISAFDRFEGLLQHCDQHQDISDILLTVTDQEDEPQQSHFRYFFHPSKYETVQCYRCQEYGHIARFCPVILPCLLCGRLHEESEDNCPLNAFDELDLAENDFCYKCGSECSPDTCRYDSGPSCGYCYSDSHQTNQCEHRYDGHRIASCTCCGKLGHVWRECLYK